MANNLEMENEWKWNVIRSEDVLFILVFVTGKLREAFLFWVSKLIAIFLITFAI
jgi:hypothetical protein